MNHYLAESGPYPPETVIVDTQLGMIYRIGGETLALIEKAPVAVIRREHVEPGPTDLIAEIERRHWDAYIDRQRSELKAICGDYLDNSYIIPNQVADQLGEPGWMKQLNEAEDLTITYKRWLPGDVEPEQIRTALIAFAVWLLKDENGEGREIELVDQFLRSGRLPGAETVPDDLPCDCAGCNDPHLPHEA